MLVGDANGRGGGLHILDVGLQQLFTAVFDRPDADHRRQRHDRAAHHRLLEILLVILRKSRDLLLEQLELDAWARFEALQALAHIGEEARLGEFTIGDDVDAAIDLPAHHVGDGGAQCSRKSGLIVRLPGIFGFHDVEQPVRPRQAADMRGLDTIGVLLHRHGCNPLIAAGY
jgi:hypothetical protein